MKDGEFMKILSSYLEKVHWDKFVGVGVKVFITLVLAWVAQAILKKILSHTKKQLLKRKMTEGEPLSESAKRVDTLMGLIQQGVMLCVWGTVGMIVLGQVGVEIGPILAGAGIVGVAVGFGAQNLVKDVISGFFLILENQVRVGDVVVINGTGGLVEEIDFRKVVLRDLTGTVHIIPSGAITTLSNRTYKWSAYVFDVGVAYKENTDEVVKVLREVCDGLRRDGTIGPLILGDAEIFGVDKLDDSAVVIKGRIKTKPIQQWTVGREFLRRVKLTFDEKGIEIPFPHRTVYFGEVSKPFDLRLLQGEQILNKQT